MKEARNEVPWSTLLRKSSRRAGMSRNPPVRPRWAWRNFWTNKVFWLALTAIGTIVVAGVAILDSRQTENSGNVPAPAKLSRVCAPGIYSGHAQGFLIDVSDPFANDNIRNRIVRAAKDELKTTPRGSAVIIAGLNDTSTDPIDITFTDCNPGSPEEVGTLFRTEAITQQAYDAFMLSAHGNLTRHLDPGMKLTSPICEGIRALSRQPEMYNAQTRRITVVTDLMQFTDSASVYPRGPRFIGQFPSSCQTDMAGYEFQLLVIPRDHSAQTKELIRFWVRSLEEMGAVVTGAHFR